MYFSAMASPISCSVSTVVKDSDLYVKLIHCLDLVEIGMHSTSAVMVLGTLVMFLYAPWQWYYLIR